MRVESVVWPNRAWRRRQPAGVVLAAAVFSLAGCGGGGGGGRLGGPPAASDHYFFVGVPEPEDLTEIQRRKRIDEEIERLASPAWRTARKNLFRLGKPAVDRLILNLERTEVSSASLRPVPGPTLPEPTQTWSLGHVVYTVLIDFISNYTSHEGTDLPGFDRKDWRDWWARNAKGIRVYAPENTAPEYVRVQLAEAREAMSSRYQTVVAKAKSVEEKRKAKLKKERAEQGARLEKKARKAEERRAKRSEEEPKAKPKRGRKKVEEEAKEAEKELAKEVEEEDEEAKEEPKKEPEEEEKKPSRRRGRRRRRK